MRKLTQKLYLEQRGMRGIFAVFTVVFACLVFNVESTDSNTAVDLMSLGRAMCRRKMILYTGDNLDFCYAAKKELCSQFKTKNSASCRKINSHPRLGYQINSVKTNVCGYQGRDSLTKRFKEELIDRDICETTKQS